MLEAVDPPDLVFNTMKLLSRCLSEGVKLSCAARLFCHLLYSDAVTETWGVGKAIWMNSKTRVPFPPSVVSASPDDPEPLLPWNQSGDGCKALAL